MVSSGTVMNSSSVIRRNPPGTKCEDFFKWPDQSFDEMDSTLAAQQYIQQMIKKDHVDIDGILTAPAGQDEGVWKYEHLRQFCLELNGLAVKLQGECSAETCPQMTATEQWIFLCAAHKTPKECPAIDYTRHTLDGAANLLNTSKYFPSRVSIKESSVAKLGSVCRRVYRIFSHAYYHHRHIFDEAENENYLCRRFTVFVTKYNLMSQDNLIVPILDANPSNQSNNNSVSTVTVTLAKKPPPPSEEPSSRPGIISFLNLPEGVVPDPDEDDEENTVSLDLTEVELSASDEVDGGSTEVDEDFAYSGEGTVEYGTLKPGEIKGSGAASEDKNSSPDNSVEMAETAVVIDEVQGGGDVASSNAETTKHDGNQV